MSDHGHRVHDKPVDPAQPLVDLILPTLRQIQGGMKAGESLTVLEIFEHGVILETHRLAGKTPGPATLVGNVNAGL